MSKQPNQPLVLDERGVIRFKSNPVVEFLYEKLGAHLSDREEVALKNEMFSMVYTGKATKEDMAQFAQLIGYSVSGFGELSYVPKKLVAKMDEKADELRALIAPAE